MFYLLLSITCSSIIFVLFKFFEKYNISNIQAITVNYLSAVLLGYFSTQENISYHIVIDKPWLSLAAVSGIMLMLTFIIYAISVQKAGIAITSVLGKMSVIIPVLLGFIMFQEKITWIRITGIILALTAFVFTLQRSSKQKTAIKYLILPVLLFIGNGLNDCFFKIAQELYICDDYTTFLITAFFVSMAIGMVTMLVLLISKKEKLHYKNLVAGILLGIFNWFSTYFFLVGLSCFDVSVFVPVFNASIVCIAALTGYFFFREKLTKTNIIGIILAIIAIILIAGIK
ncbi:MAG TPA: DMT family transporter [Bacteroidales bacterium]|nr:DMT family transporter [Bacteroidales bacterium]